MNHWVVIPHDFRPMPESEFQTLCIVCGGHLHSRPHPDNVFTWPLSRLLSNTTGLDGPRIQTRAR